MQDDKANNSDSFADADFYFLMALFAIYLLIPSAVEDLKFKAKNKKHKHTT